MIEFGHAMGNSTGNQREYWDAVYSYKRLLGGLIWEWSDLGIAQRTEDGKIWYAYGGDFGDEPHSGPFCMDGLTFPDRGVKPSLLEYKKAIEPVRLEAVQPFAGRVRVQNRYHYVTLAHLTGEWRLMRDGQELERGELGRLATAPGEEISLNLPLSRGLLNEPGEYWVHIRFALAEASAWAPAGHEIAWADIPLTEDGLRELRSGALAPAGEDEAAEAWTGAAPLQAQESGRELAIAGDGFRLVFDKLQGCITSWEAGETSLLCSGPRLNLWRAPVDNDVHTAKEWKKAGYDRLVSSVRRFTIDELGADLCRVTVELALGARGEGMAFCATLQYELDRGGELRMDVAMEALKELPSLPRFGLELRMPDRCDRLSWFGLGPHECYPDRKDSGKLGLYAGTVAEQFVPYEHPQENGNKSDVRWCTITDDKGSGLRFSGAPLFEMSAHHYSAADLTEADHVHRLTRRNETIVNLDAGHSGIGNHSCGYAPTMDKYLLSSDSRRFRITITPLFGKNSTARE
jgi:beta-galactosidase